MVALAADHQGADGEHPDGVDVPRSYEQLRRQIGYALDAGLTKREICETFAQSGWYRGWPYVEDALEEAKVVFAERGI